MNKEELEKLCKEYNYTYREIGQFIRISSIRDNWYIINSDFPEWVKITLYHENFIGKLGMHKHDKHKTIQDIFKCIYSHDNREMNRSNKMTRLNILFKIAN